jgi:uncharacterized repeat protein (TIGR01451 family)
MRDLLSSVRLAVGIPRALRVFLAAWVVIAGAVLGTVVTSSLAGATAPTSATITGTITPTGGGYKLTVHGTWKWSTITACTKREGTGWSVGWWGLGTTSSLPSPNFSLTHASTVSTTSTKNVTPAKTTNATISGAKYALKATGRTPSYFYEGANLNGYVPFYTVSGSPPHTTETPTGTCSTEHTSNKNKTIVHGTWSAHATYATLTEIPGDICVNLYDLHTFKTGTFTPGKNNDNTVHNKPRGSNTSTFNPSTPAQCWSPETIYTTLTAPGTSTIGGSWSDTATVTGNSTGKAPTGTVTFYLCKTPEGTTCTATTGNEATPTTPTRALTAGSGNTSTSASITVTPSSAGRWCFSAVYGGNSKYFSAKDNTTGTTVATETHPECFTVTKGSPAISTTASGSVVVGHAVHDTAVVSGGHNPSGTITFKLYGPSATAVCTNLIGTVTKTFTGDGTFTSPTLTPTTPGTYYWTASVPATQTDAAFSSPCGAAHETVVITKPTTSTTTTSSPNVTLGGKIHDTAHVSGTSTSGAPTGTVTFLVCGPASNAELCTTTTAGEHAVATKAATKKLQTTNTHTTKFVSTTFTPPSAGKWCWSAVFHPTATQPLVGTVKPAAAVSPYTGSSDNLSGDPQPSECTTVTTPNTPPSGGTPSPATFTLTKSDTPGNGKSVVPGATIDYTILVKNVGTSRGAATLTDPLPSNVTLSGTPAPACKTVASGDTCSVKVTGTKLVVTVTMASKDSAKIVFDAVVNSNDTTTVVNKASITHGPCVSHCSSTVTNPVVVLTVVKGSSPPPGSIVPPLTKVTYTLTATDSGTAPTTPVTLTDTVPAGTTYVSGSATCGTAPGCAASESGGKVVWTPVVVQPGHPITVSFQVIVSKGDKNGQKIKNVAVFTNDGTPNCTAATCLTNTVTLKVTVTSSAATGSTPPTTGGTPPTTVPQATTTHTGEPWAGSGWLELTLLLTGLGLLAIGGSLRRRRRTKPAAR